MAFNEATISGGGLRVNNSVVGNLESTIIAKNTAATGPDIVITGSGTISANSFNLVGIDSGHTITNGLNNNKVGTINAPLDPLLGNLQDNDGPTITMHLLPNSPAIDMGSNPLNLAFDQRGTGFPRVIGIQIDIGAFEFLPDADDDDMDGIPAGCDNCSEVPNSNQVDKDSDGVGDVCDNCPTIENSGQGDINNNLVGDACERTTRFKSLGSGGSSSLQPCLLLDSDGDGINDCFDLCPYSAGMASNPSGCYDGSFAIPPSINTAPKINDTPSLGSSQMAGSSSSSSTEESRYGCSSKQENSISFWVLLLVFMISKISLKKFHTTD